VGHCTDAVNRTGCTVAIFDERTIAGVDVRGGNPGTKDTDLLRPMSSMTEVHGVMLTGGSTFGLESAMGATRYLEQMGRGFDVGVARIPIVPAAVIYDLSIGSAKVRPDLAMGIKACEDAREGEFETGCVGAGTGATAGKLYGSTRSSTGGIGSAVVEVAGGVRVGALMVVNSFGDVIDRKTGKIVAGSKNEAGEFVDTYQELKRGVLPLPTFRFENTTIGLVSCNCKLTKEQANRIAMMAQNGIARAVSPPHTSVDGDLIFATGKVNTGPTCSVDLLGSAAAEAVEIAIVNAVTSGSRLPLQYAILDHREEFGAGRPV
jgi:L-aminopeptidase/D-esterase-like protein